MQRIFNPIDYGFSFTADWYEWDYKAGHSAAMKDRNKQAKELKAQGYRVVKFSLSDQLVRRGGIGTGNPDIEMWVNCYGFNAYKD